MSMIIGIDPHKALHAASAIDRTETQLAALKIRTGPRQLAQLLEWAAPFACRTWAIESAGGLGYLLAQQLVARGEHVVDVPSTLASRVRLLGSGGRTRTTRTTPVRSRCRVACTVAAARPRRGSRQRAAPVGQSAPRHQPRQARACSRLHAMVNELVAGGIRKEVVVNQAERSSPGSNRRRQRNANVSNCPRTPRRHPFPRRQDEALQGPASARR